MGRLKRRGVKLKKKMMKVSSVWFFCLIHFAFIAFFVFVEMLFFRF